MKRPRRDSSSSGWLATQRADLLAWLSETPEIFEATAKRLRQEQPRFEKNLLRFDPEENFEEELVRCGTRPLVVFLVSMALLAETAMAGPSSKAARRWADVRIDEEFHFHRNAMAVLRNNTRVPSLQAPFHIKTARFSFKGRRGANSTAWVCSFPKGQRPDYGTGAVWCQSDLADSDSFFPMSCRLVVAPPNVDYDDFYFFCLLLIVSLLFLLFLLAFSSCDSLFWLCILLKSDNDSDNGPSLWGTSGHED
jgi:hypothetical protein